MKKTISKFKDFDWIDIKNPTESELVSLELPFDIDQNYLEDALEAGHLPKFERNKDYFFIILRAYTADENEKAIEVGEISNKIAFFIHKKALITIHRADFQFLENIPESFNTTDELTLHIVKELFLTFEEPIRKQSDKMDILEQTIFLKKGNNLSVENLYYEKARARLAKKILLIMQNVINQFKVDESLNTTLQDLKDTIAHLLLKNEELFDDANALLNTYITFTAQKSNDVMKLLTIFSAFFLPLTFLAGVYGMNFDNMPELKWEYGYFISLGMMVIVCIVIYSWFKRKKIM